jgi:hypothetical protein
MRMSYPSRVAAALTLALVVLVASPAAAGIKIKVEFDKTYNFGALKTYGWHPDGAGDVKLLELMGEDPAVILKRFDPVLKSALEVEFARRGLVPAPAGSKPDFYVHYYILIGPNSESQFRGQFIGGVPPWGLPDFAMTTTALKIFEQGTVVLDFINAARMEIIWRGIGEAELQRQRTATERDKRVRDGVVQLLKKFPVKPTKK